MREKSEMKPTVEEGRFERRVRLDAKTDERREAQRKRLDALLQGRKQTPLKWNEFGNYPLAEMG
jgi:hypothetical protein